jgi:hypothetical protein
MKMKKGDSDATTAAACMIFIHEIWGTLQEQGLHCCFADFAVN